jgi:hypothetical protein
MRSRIAKPLLTSLGTITLLAASSFVVVAVSSTGSAKPWDWTRADPSAAVSRYQICGHQGLGAVGCMLGSSFRPASAAAGTTPAGARTARQPLFSVATVQDPAPGEAPGQPAKPTTGRAPTSGTRPDRLVKVPSNASTADVLAACQAAMKTAQAETNASTKDADTKAVEMECEADLAAKCPAAAKPPQATTGPAVMQELQDECRASMQQGPRPGGDD